jgi:excisionase family DNA binding protein
MPKKMLVAEAAKVLDVTPATVRDMERRGELVAERTSSGVRLFDRADVDRLATARASRKARGK